MIFIDRWTGREAAALQRAMRLTNEGFAQHLGMATRTVAGWHARPERVVVPVTQSILDTALHQAEEAVQTRFRHVLDNVWSAAPSPAHASSVMAEVEERLTSDPDVAAALTWLDRCTDADVGSSRAKVTDRLTALDRGSLHDRAYRRGRIQRGDLATALSTYYRLGGGHHRAYSAKCAEDLLETTVLTTPEWLDISQPVASVTSKFSLSGPRQGARQSLPAFVASAAVERLAEVVAHRTKLVNAPIYRLLDHRICQERVEAAFALAEFVEYALTMDLLEWELVDALIDGREVAPGSLPLRDHYLGDVSAVLATQRRLCVGGPVALCAFARPGRMSRGSPPDYVLLVQERGSKVLNSARRLAVIPKAFHGPLVDYGEDAHVAATLEREMEEELFGRSDVDSTMGHVRHADPMHPNRLSPPMRWLSEHPDHWRMEHTGFGINLISGNFEFGTLIVVEDEDWWDLFGGDIQANWESLGLRRYSSLDRPGLAGLAGEPSWSNEGLFALLQGLRRLSEIGGSRVDMPSIEVRL
ncbi:hypothetical protein ACWGR4_37490 [Embleya sp. NPDC055664]